MEMEHIVDVDTNEEQVSELMESKTVEVSGNVSSLDDIASDIQTAHAELDNYKSGSLSLSQTLSEASKEVEDEALQAILMDMSNGAFGVYLRLHRGDLELLGERDGEYSGFLTE